MIDKLLLNNEIITNKEKIQQAKINTISKIVQKIRRLKALIEKKPEYAKNKISLRKSIEILNSLKKLKPSDIVRQGLVADKKPTAIITNSQSSPEEIASALIWLNKKVAEYLVHLKSLLKYDNNKSTWKDDILEVSKRKQKFLKVEVKKEKRKEKKEKKILTVKREEWLVENTISNEDLNTKLHEKVVEIPNNVSVTDLKAVTLPSANKNKKSTKCVNPIKKIEEQQNNCINLDLDNQYISDEDDKVEQDKKEVDSFFITESGENYMSTAVIVRTQPESVNDGLVRKDRRANIQRPRHLRKKQFNHYEKPHRSLENVNNHKFLHKTIDFKRDSSLTETTGKLHPSWAAKQKQKIQEFSGKKLKFDNQNETALLESDLNKINLKTTKNERNILEIKEGPIHPSWAAKQKLKPAIAQFQGKKVVFE